MDKNDFECLWIGSLIAYRNGMIKYASGLVRARSAAEATGLLLEWWKHEWPVEQGWRQHDVDVSDKPLADLLRNLDVSIGV